MQYSYCSVSSIPSTATTEATMAAKRAVSNPYTYVQQVEDLINACQLSSKHHYLYFSAEKLQLIEKLMLIFEFLKH